MEIAIGWLPGLVAMGDDQRSSTVDARRALELAVLPALARAPCLVAFSGGRDSSAVLAVTTRLAQKEGLPLPIPITKVYPRSPGTDETSWQELVLRHLGTPDWARLHFDDELDLVGPVAAAGLRRHGLLWPPSAHGYQPLFSSARGGSLVTGEGGDEVFGPRRAAAMKHLLAGRLRPGRTTLRLLLAAVGPMPVRRRAIYPQRRSSACRPWLRPVARDALTDALLDDDLAEPFSWAASAGQLPRRRAWAHGRDTIDVLAAESDVLCIHPLVEPAFIEALGTSARRLGFMSRTAAMVLLFGDVLPDELLRRKTKVVFNEVAFNRHSREFARTWDGGGIDPALVDPEALRAEWLSQAPHAGVSALLQSAWLAGRRGN